VVLGPWDYEVFRDGKLVARPPYGKTVEFSAGGVVKE
jgi:hypothetical protein